MEEKTHTSVGIFIFNEKPNPDYEITLRSFFNLSLGMEHVFQYTLLEDTIYGNKYSMLDIMTKIILDLKKLNQYRFHNIIVYIDNKDTEIFGGENDLLWFKMFDIYSIEHMIYIYREYVLFELPLFSYRTTPQEDQIVIDSFSVDLGLINRCILIDNFPLEELCSTIMTTYNSLDVFQFLINRRSLMNKTVIYTNFPMMSIQNLFYNYNFRGVLKYEQNDIIPIFNSTIGNRLLKLFYKDLFSPNRNKLTLNITNGQN